MQNVASYKAATTLETEKKVNVVYGLNGTGKSTLSNFLYEPTAAGFEGCSVDISDDEVVYVYNQRFIQDNFYETDSLKGIFSLSKENKDIEQKINAAENALAEHNVAVEIEEKACEEEKNRIDKKKDEACEVTWKIRKQYTGGDRILEFCLDGLKSSKETLFDSLSNRPKPDVKPEKDITKIKKDVEAIRGDSAKPYDPLPLVQFDEHDIEDHEIFSEIVVGSKNSPVSALIEELQNSDWVRQGLAYVGTPGDDEKLPCPFCQEKTISNTLAAQIENYFDQSFEDATDLISRLSSRYGVAAEHLGSLESYNSNPYAEDQLAALTKKHRALGDLLRKNIGLIENKVSTPSAPVTLISSRNAVEEFNSILENINEEIVKHNERLENSEQELAKLKQEFWALMRWEYDQTIASWITELASSQKVLAEAKARMEEASQSAAAKKSEIALLQKSTINIEDAIESINNSLLQIGMTDFSIEKHSNDLYKIVRTGQSTAKFTSLSEGEKMIISFLYFCELCKGKRNAEDTVQKKVAVIDDPISSLSHIFVFNIGQLLKSEFFNSDTFVQVFVLTHSLYFFYDLADANHMRRKETQNLYRITKNSAGSSIRSMKYEEVQNDYHSYWLIVTDSSQPPALIANCMRNIIEYFFNFVQKKDLNNVFQMAELQDNRYQAFCRYLNRESHSLGQNIFDYKEFNFEEFRDGLKQVFEATGYSDHYKKMMANFGDD